MPSTRRETTPKAINASATTAKAHYPSDECSSGTGRDTVRRARIPPVSGRRTPARRRDLGNERPAGAGGVTAVHPDAGVLGPDGVRGRARGLRRVRQPGVHGRDRVRRHLVHRFGSGLVRGPLVVDRGHRGGRCRRRPAAPADPPARADPRADRRPAGGARRPEVGPGDRGRVGGVADRRRQPRPGEGTGLHRRRCRHLDVPAARARRRRRAGEHPAPVSPARTAGCSRAP